MQFNLNGDIWRIKSVNPDSSLLIDRTGRKTLATTDPKRRIIFLSSGLRGPLLKRVLVHELGHCTMISYNLLDDIHKMVKPEHWIDAEEWICNYLMDYGINIFTIIKNL